jgi:acetyl-CoA C-acetyltransferase
MPISQRQTRPVAIVGGLRIPFCRMGTNYAEKRLVDLMSDCLKGMVTKYDLTGEKIDDVSFGTVFDHPAVWNFFREAVLASGLDKTTPAFGTTRACATGLDASINIANKIALGQIECGIAGGAESLSDTPVFLNHSIARRLVNLPKAKSIGDKLKLFKGVGLNDLKPMTTPPAENTTGKTMGEHCEEMVKHWKVTREEQDQIAFQSHQNAAKAYERGFYKNLLMPYEGADKDNNVRPDTTVEKLAKLKPAFDRSAAGTITAGNASPLTDGASTLLLASEDWAKKHGLPVLAYLTEYQSSAIDFQQEGLLMAPVYAIATMLKRMQLGFKQFDFFEIHEAFAGQVACTLKALEDKKYCQDKLGLPDALGPIDRKLLNVAGGSVALGHPFGATGARILMTLASLITEKGSGRGLISICAGGGMGTVAVIEK